MSNSRIVYAPRPDATAETEVSTLANVYRFVLDRAHKNAAGMTSTNGDDAMKGFTIDRAKCSIQD